MELEKGLASNFSGLCITQRMTHLGPHANAFLHVLELAAKSDPCFHGLGCAPNGPSPTCTLAQTGSYRNRLTLCQLPCLPSWPLFFFFLTPSFPPEHTPSASFPLSTESIRAQTSTRILLRNNGSAKLPSLPPNGIPRDKLDSHPSHRRYRQRDAARNKDIW